MLIPAHSLYSLAISLLMVGAVGLARVANVIRQMRQHAERGIVDKGHWWWHGFLPLSSYSLIFIAGLWLAFAGSLIVLSGMALAILVLLTCSIRNTWVLVLWIAHQR